MKSHSSLNIVSNFTNDMLALFFNHVLQNFLFLSLVSFRCASFLFIFMRSFSSYSLPFSIRRSVHSIFYFWTGTSLQSLMSHLSPLARNDCNRFVYCTSVWSKLISSDQTSISVCGKALESKHFANFVNEIFSFERSMQRTHCRIPFSNSKCFNKVWTRVLLKGQQKGEQQQP